MTILPKHKIKTALINVCLFMFIFIFILILMFIFITVQSSWRDSPRGCTRQSIDLSLSQNDPRWYEKADRQAYGYHRISASCWTEAMPCTSNLCTESGQKEKWDCNLRAYISGRSRDVRKKKTTEKG